MKTLIEIENYYEKEFEETLPSWDRLSFYTHSMGGSYFRDFEDWSKDYINRTFDYPTGIMNHSTIRQRKYNLRRKLILKYSNAHLIWLKTSFNWLEMQRIHPSLNRYECMKHYWEPYFCVTLKRREKIMKLRKKLGNSK